MNYLEYKRQYWDLNHSSNDMNNYVTDVSLNEICKYHSLPHPYDKTILEIGIGYGGLTNDLAKNNNKIYGVDISEIALNRVKHICENTFLTENINMIPPVDLAISHLVFQHNPEFEVYRIINDVNLKNRGIFSFQIASFDIDNLNLTPLIANDINEGMLYFYSLDKIEKIVNLTNKKIVEISKSHWHDDPYCFEWRIIKVMNR